LNEFFEDTNRDTFSGVHTTYCAINELGKLYSKSFHEALDKVYQKHQDGTSFKVPVRFISGEPSTY